MIIDSSEPQFIEVARLLINPIRLKILSHTKDFEIDMTTLKKIIGCSQSSISQNCAILEQWGLITIRRSEKNVKFVRANIDTISFKIVHIHSS